MREVWKYALPIGGTFAVSMPADAQPVAVQLQGGKGWMWALGSPDAPRAYRHFKIFGTGHPIPDGARHVGTFQELGGALVWHLFEVNR